MNPVWSALLGMNAFLVDEFLSEIPFSEASPLKSFSSFCRQSYTGTLLYNVILDGGFLIWNCTCTSIRGQGIVCLWNRSAERQTHELCSPTSPCCVTEAGSAITLCPSFLICEMWPLSPRVTAKRKQSPLSYIYCGVSIDCSLFVLLSFSNTYFSTVTRLKLKWPLKRG